MRLKFLLVISAAYFVLISGILYLGLQREKNREEFWIKENSALQLHAINDNVGLEIEKLKVEAVKVATAMEANQKEDAIKALSQFAGVAAVGLDSDTYSWKIDSAKPDIWSGPWYQRAKEIPESESQPRFFAVQTHDDDLGSVIRSVVFFSAKIKEKASANKKTVRLVGILAQPLFQNIIVSQQSAGMQFFIFSQKGLAIAHSISDYVGNSLAGDKLYEEIKRNKVAIGNFSHKDFKGDAVVSIYERIDRTDLTVVSQLRPSQWSVIDWGYYGQAYMIIFGVFGLLTGAMFFVIPKSIGKTKEIVIEKLVEKIVEKPVDRVVERFIEKPVDPNQEAKPTPAVFEKVAWQRSQQKHELNSISQTGGVASSSISSGSVPPIPAHIFEKLVKSVQQEEAKISSANMASTLNMPSTLNTENTTNLVSTPLNTAKSFGEITASTSGLPTKMSILAKVISQIKAPFLSILGHVQIAKSHPQGGSLQSIENEARSAREILDRLAQFSGLAQVPTATVPLLDLVDGALRSLEGPILRGAIKISKDISDNICIKCDTDDFKMALTAIFRNSIEAMERVLKKELTITATKVNNSLIEIRITDTGEGILPRNLPYLFEPFYSTKSPLDHKGLGLAAVQGIMRTHLGEVSISSDPDQGTTVSITIPISIETPKRLADIQMMGRPAWMDLIKTPSRQELAESESLLEPIEIKKTELPKFELPAPVVAYSIDDTDVDFELRDFNFSDMTKDSSKVAELATFSTEIKPGPKSEPVSQNSAGPDQQALEKSLLFASPVKRLKKKFEPLDKLKVQIPRPEEKL